MHRRRMVSGNRTGSSGSQPVQQVFGSGLHGARNGQDQLLCLVRRRRPRRRPRWRSWSFRFRVHNFRNRRRLRRRCCGLSVGGQFFRQRNVDLQQVVHQLMMVLHGRSVRQVVWAHAVIHHLHGAAGIEPREAVDMFVDWSRFRDGSGERIVDSGRLLLDVVHQKRIAGCCRCCSRSHVEERIR